MGTIPLLELLLKKLASPVSDLLLGSSLGLLEGSLLSPALDVVLHDSALATLGSLDHFAGLLVVSHRILLLVDASSSILDSLGHALRLLLLHLLVLVALLLLVFASFLILVVVVSVLRFGGSDHVTLLLHAVGLLAVAVLLIGLSAFACDAAKLLVALDKLIKRLVVHRVVHLFLGLLCGNSSV